MSETVDNAVVDAKIMQMVFFYYSVPQSDTACITSDKEEGYSFESVCVYVCIHTLLRV